MKPGDVVELKAGTLGLSGDDLLALYIDRTKRSKNYLAVVHTKKGTKEVDTDRIKRTVLRSRVQDPAELDEGDRTARLRQLVSEVREAAKAREERDVPDELDDRRLWELTVNEVEGTITPDEATELIYGPLATGEEKGEVRAAFQSCQTKGVGYFERASGRGEQWAPRTVEEIKAIRREIEGMHKLRNKLIRVEQVWDEGLEEEITKITPLSVEEANLGEEDLERLELVGAYMADFVLHDTDRGHIGLAGTNTHTLDGFSLFRFCRFLAFDWLGDTRASISGAMLRFALETGLLNVSEAIDLVARRHVKLSEFMAWEYPEDALRSAERLERGIPAGELDRRRDLRDLETYTIDPPDAKDFDDAISVVEEGEHTHLYVHIADVAHYVEQGSTVDHEARRRGTSTYLPTGVLPMLPPRLADDLCSLRDDEDRMAMTAKLTIDADGHVVDTSFHESIIRVDQNLAYGDVDQAIEQGREPFASIKALADRLGQHRRGMALETDELKVHIESDKVDPHLKSGTQATKLIERFMVAANEAVAEALTEADVPAPYRCHPLPDRFGAERFNQRMEVMELPYRVELPTPSDEEEAPGEEAAEEDFLEALKGGKVELMSGGFKPQEEEAPPDDGADEEEEEEGVSAPKMKGLADLPEEEREAWLTPFQEILDEVEDVEDPQLQDLIRFKLLTTMGRAFYTPENIGHFGLGSTRYLHFTSPIRRYPDLITHRQLKWLVRGGEESGEELPHTKQDVADIAPTNTDQAVEAEHLERDLISVAMAFEARTDTWSGTHSAMVNGITKGSVFLSMPKGVEARLGTKDIPGGPWSVDEAGAMLFKGSLDDPSLGVEDLGGGNWREQYNEEMEEFVYVRLRLGDREKVTIRDYDLVRGRIHCRLASGPGSEGGDGEGSEEEDPADEGDPAEEAAVEGEVGEGETDEGAAVEGVSGQDGQEDDEDEGLDR